MKKIFSIFFAGLIALLAASCIPDENLPTYYSQGAKAPVVGQYEMGKKALTVAYTPGSFNMGFNEKMPVNHKLVIVSVDGTPVEKAVTSSSKDNVLTASVTSLSTALVSLGYQEEQTVNFDLIIRATMQNAAQDNGRNGYVDSKDIVSVTGFVVTFPKGSPYQEYTATSPFSVIGSISGYEMSWDKDLQMWMTEDGNQHVAKCVSLKAGDEFKFRKDQDWGVNYGGDFASLDTPFGVSQDGPNIKAPADGLYDLWLDLSAGTAMLTEAYQAYPDHKDASNWTVIGALSEYGISWNDDIVMVTDGTTHIAQGVKLAADDEFKFRQDKSWDVNLGGDFGSLGTDFGVSQDGPNIKVGAAGVYDLIVNPGAGTAQIVETMGGGKSGIIGGDEPGPEPTPVTGWNIIGLNGDWENDILATQHGNQWVAYITANESTEFKWRKDAGWDENYGGVMVALGEPFAAEAGGANIKVDAGFWKVVLDTEALTITVSAGDVWSLIGGFNEWAGDVDMELVDGKWVSPETKLSGEFKIRHNHDWAENVGGTMVALGEPFAAEAGGANINVDEGTYVVTYDPAAATITVVNAKKIWGVIGVNGDWNNDINMEEVMPGIWMSPKIEVTGEGWKVRFDHNWDVNRGGATPTAVGQFVAAVPNGDNLNITGTFKVVYNANNGTIGTLGWGVVGTINGWNGDVPMNLASDGKWYSIPVKLTAEDQFKIRKDADWAENFGGAMAAVDEPFDAVAGGDNLKVAEDGTYMVVYDPAAGKLTVSKKYWGLVGAFNGWGGDPDVFMLFDGAKWCAYGQTVTGDWKIREGSDWANNRGGAFATAGTPFTAVPGGDNINLGDMTNFSVVYDPAAETITIQ